MISEHIGDAGGRRFYDPDRGDAIGADLVGAYAVACEENGITEQRYLREHGFRVGTANGIAKTSSPAYLSPLWCKGQPG